MKANKFYTLSLISCMISSSVAAQEFKTNESISDQLKKGTVPGTKVSSEIPAKKTQRDTEPKQKISVSVKKQLLDGTYPGTVIAKTAPANAAPAAQPAKTTFASDSKPVAVKTAKPVAMPLMQEEKKETSAPPVEKAVIKEVPVQIEQKQE